MAEKKAKKAKPAEEPAEEQEPVEEPAEELVDENGDPRVLSHRDAFNAN